MKPKSSRIYVLSDPRNLSHRFVGCSRKAEGQLAAHNPLYKSGELTEWRASLALRGLKPTVTFLETIKDGVDWCSRLNAWTEMIKAAGHDLIANPWRDPGHKPARGPSWQELKAEVASLREQLAQKSA